MKRTAANRKGTETGRAGGRSRRGRAALMVGFAFGAAFGLALGAVAYFMDLNAASGGILAYGVRVTGHRDILEDVFWFLSGGFIGGMFAAYAAWRSDRTRAAGIGKEHVLNRTFRVLDGGIAEGTRETPPRGGDAGSGNRP